MTDWYYHQPGRGRVGPLSADDMRTAYRERVIGRGTLAWHEGLREWQPLERLIEELGLSDVQPDGARPPPMPPPPAAATASHAGPMRGTAPPSNRNGCLIAVVVIGAMGLVLLAILAAIALPAYQDYVERSKAIRTGQTAQDTRAYDADRMAQTDALARELVTAAMREFYTANGNACPDAFEFETLQVRHPRYQGSENDGWFVIDQARPQSGACAYTVGFHGLGVEVRDKRVQYEVSIDGDDIAIDCRNQTIPAGYVPPRCGA